MIETPADLWLALRMAAWSAALPVLKRVVPLRVLTRLMWARTRVRRSDREAKVTFLARRIYRARPFLRRDNCLERSLVAYRFLAREGHDPRLVLGVRKVEGQIQAHAWITVDGRPVIDDHEALDQYTTLAVFGAGGTRSDGGAAASATPVAP